MTKEVLIFIEFVLVGVIISFVFDIFRAIRKYKKPNIIWINIQDLIFWLLTGAIILLSTFYFNNGEVRIYILVAMSLGVVIYMCIISTYLLKIIYNLIVAIMKFITYISKPIVFVIKKINLILNFIKKNVKKYCNKSKYVISFIHSNLDKIRVNISNKKHLGSNRKNKFRKVYSSQIK